MCFLPGQKEWHSQRNLYTANNANITCLHVYLTDVKVQAKVSRTKSPASQGSRKPTARDHSQAPVGYSRLGSWMDNMLTLWMPHEFSTLITKSETIFTY